MKSFLFRMYLAIMKFWARLSAVKDNEVVVLNGAGRSGSNGYLFYKYLLIRHPEFRVTLVEPWPSSHLSWSTWQRIGSAKYILTTHQPFKIKKKQVSIQLWHGVPLKRMGMMAKNTNKKDNRRNHRLWEKQTDIICANSDYYETMMSACLGLSSDKYQKVGFPRLTFLKKPAISKSQLLQDLFGVRDKAAQVGIYLPTFRYELENDEIIDRLKKGNFFAFYDFSIVDLNAALKKKHQYLIVKMHPYEMSLLKNKYNYSNVAFLDDTYLLAHNYDLYELLGRTDFLLTDFSSVWFDYLILNKPIIFITNYLKEYEKSRGLLVGPYQEIMPGPQINNQQELVEILAKDFTKNWQLARLKWKKATDQVNEAKACNNIFAFLTK